MNARVVIDAILAALIAPPCAVCGRLIDQPLEGAVCDRCWDAVMQTAPRFSLPGIRCGRAIGPYDGVLRDIIHAFKYDGRRSLAPRLSRMMAVQGRDVLDGADVVVAVPLHWRRRRKRGFNQAVDLARGLGVPRAAVLRRTRHTTPQVELPSEQRQSNIRGAIVSCGPWALQSCLARPDVSRLPGATVVLVDDVTTTGATLEACARALKRAGVREVRALTAARVESRAHATRPG